MNYSDLTSLASTPASKNIQADIYWRYETPLVGKDLANIIKGATSAGLVVAPSLSRNGNVISIGTFAAYVRDVSVANVSGLFSLLPLVLIQVTTPVSITVASTKTTNYVVFMYRYTEDSNSLSSSYYTTMTKAEYDALPSIRSVTNRTATTVYKEDVCVIAQYDATTVSQIPWRTSGLDQVTLNEAQTITGQKTFTNPPQVTNPAILAQGSQSIATVGQLYSALKESTSLEYTGTVSANIVVGAVFMS